MVNSVRKIEKTGRFGNFMFHQKGEEDEK